MSAVAGWYPDPHGGYGQLRYWNGHSWTAHTTLAVTAGPTHSGDAGPAVPPGAAESGSVWATPTATPTATPMPTDPVTAWSTPSGADPTAVWSAPPAAAPPGGMWPPGTSPPGGGPARARRFGLIAAGVVAVLALVLGVGWLFGRPTSQREPVAPAAGAQGTPDGSGDDSGATESLQWPTVAGISCAPVDSPEAAAQGDADRVSAGGLSYPMPPDPWPQPDVSGSFVPLASAAAEQMVRVADYRDSGWAAGLLVAELRGDAGLESVEQAATVVAGCMLATQYVPAMSQAETRNEAATVDGHRAWVIDSTISLDDPDLPVTEEAMSVTVVETAPGRYAAFWSSIPKVDPDYSAVAATCRKGLRVD